MNYIMLGVMLFCLIIGAAGGYYFEKSRIPSKLTDQQTTDKQECEQAQQITKGANDVLQKDRDDIAAQLTTFKLQQPAACLQLAGTTHIPSAGAKPPAANGNRAGISTDWLRDYAAQAEQYRTEVGVCKDFLAQERTLINGQK